MTNHRIWWRDYETMSELYEGESDRAAAIFGCSFLEVQLRNRIRSQFITDNSIEQLFRGYGPLSSLSAKIEIGYALGMLTKDVKQDFNLIRKIRNHFAHHHLDASFDVAPVKDLCANLKIIRGVFLDKDSVHIDEQRDQFILTIALGLALVDKGTVSISTDAQSKEKPRT